MIEALGIPVAGTEGTPGPVVHLPDDRYIPVRTDDLVAALVRDDETFGNTASELRAVSVALERIVHAESTAFERALEARYSPFNPDRETVRVGDELGDRGALAELLQYTFDKANYDRLEDAQVRAAINSARVHGMRVRVNPRKLDELLIFVRGRTQETRIVRTLWHPIVGEMRDVELYRRLAVVFRMSDGMDVNIKLFRDIPVADLEALLPHAEVGMSHFDRIKILGGGIGAIGGVTWKAVTVLVSGTLLLGQYIWLIVFGLLGLSVRSVLGYRRAKHLRNSQRTRHLYYQNIANNAGVLDLLATSICHEELKETLLAYALLVACGERIREPEDLRREVQAWMSARFHVELVFDVADALESLDRLGLWEDRPALRPLSPAAACVRLEEHWRERKSEDYHVRSLSRRA